MIYVARTSPSDRAYTIIAGSDGMLFHRAQLGVFSFLRLFSSDRYHFGHLPVKWKLCIYDITYLGIHVRRRAILLRFFANRRVSKFLTRRELEVGKEEVEDNTAGPFRAVCAIVLDSQL